MAMRLTSQERIRLLEELYQGLYDYSLSDFSKSKEKTLVHCNKCGNDFLICYDMHYNSKRGCPHCFRNGKAYDLNSFIDKANNIFHGLYDYSLSKYINSQTKLKIKCKKCGKIFLITPNSHLNGSGCPYCNRGTSKLEEELKHFLREKHISFEEQKTFPWSKEGRKIFKYDFFLNDYNCLIECQGKQHFRLGGWTKNKEKKEITFNNIERRDKEKLELAKLNKIKLFYYSNLHIEYPYKVYEDKEELLSDILSFYKENINI